MKNLFQIIAITSITFFTLVENPAFAAQDAVPQNEAGVVKTQVTEFINQIADNVINIIKNAGISDQDKYSKLKVLLFQTMDTEFMAKAALGSQARQINQSQQAEYIKAYNEYLASIYVTRFKEYNNQKYTISSIKEVGQNKILASMVIQNSESRKQPINVSYVISKVNGSYKIRDLIVENVSMIVTQKSDFSGMLKNGNVEQLIQTLKNKTGEGQ